MAKGQNIEMQLKLFTYFRSSASYRVRIALQLKGLQYEPVSKHLRRKEHRTAEFLELNPQGLLPVLAHGSQHFPQSLAIIEYIDELQHEPPLLPATPDGRAIVRAMAQIVACEIHPLCNLRVLQYLKDPLGQDQTSIDTWYRHWVADGLGALERLVARHSADGTQCYGTQITVADICLVPQMHNARRFECDLEPYPNLCAIDEWLREQPAFSASRPDLQPDAQD